MPQVYRRTGKRTGVSVHPLTALVAYLLLLCALAAILWRAAVVLAVIYAAVATVRYVRRTRDEVRRGIR